MVDINKILKEETLVCESGLGGRIPHLFSDGNMTFGDMREIFKQVFTGKCTITEKCDGQNIAITYKDGKFGVARNDKSAKDPMDMARVKEYFEGNSDLQEAFSNSMSDLSEALSSLDQMTLNRIFANGQNFLTCEIVYPPVKNLIDYGNKCFLQLNGVKCYDDKFNCIGMDESSSKEIYDLLSKHKALKQEMFEITKPNILRIKSSVSAEEALNTVLAELAKLVDGIGYKATINDFVEDQYKRYIVNAFQDKGIDLNRNSDFVKELVARLSNVSGRRPTKTDLITYAKREGVDVKSEDYKALLQYLTEHAEETNAIIMKPIESLVAKAGIMLFKNLTGFLAADPSAASRRLVTELEKTINLIESGEAELTSDKIRCFQRNMKKLENLKEFLPTEGVIIKFKNKCYKMTGEFGLLNAICGLIKYK